MKTTKACTLWAVLLAVSVIAPATGHGQVAVGDEFHGTRYVAATVDGDDSVFRDILRCGSLGNCADAMMWIFKIESDTSTIGLVLLRGCGPTQSCPEPGPPGDGPPPRNPGCGPTQTCPEPGPPEAVLEGIRRGMLYEADTSVLTGAALRHARGVISGGF